MYRTLSHVYRICSTSAMWFTKYTMIIDLSYMDNSDFSSDDTIADETFTFLD